MFAIAGVGLLVSETTTAIGQGQYPDRPIKIIVPFAAGGAVNTMARIVGEKLASTWNQPVVIENRGLGQCRRRGRGESGAGWLYAAHFPSASVGDKSAPVREPAVRSGRVCTDHSYRWSTQCSSRPSGLAVSSVPELIALAKSQPGKLTYGSAGRGSTPHLSAEMLKSLAGIEMAHVAYKSVPQAVNDVVGGSIDLTFGLSYTPSA